MSDSRENGQSKGYGRTVATGGISFGSALAMVISFNVYGSVWLAILHGLLNWLFVIWYMIFG